MTKRTTRIYACGGAAINIASVFSNTQDKPGFSDLKLSFIDTSRSNIQKFNPEESQVFILPNVDGSGKVRRENASEIANVIKKVLIDQEPGDSNIVMFSTSGGSGSVMGPLILGELLKRGETVVALVIGSSESKITTDNTIGTIKTLESKVNETNLPVVAMYEHNNGRGLKRSEIDKLMQSNISSLAALFSGDNTGLDSKDLANFVQFSRATNVPPSLVLMTIHHDAEEVAEMKSPIAIASLYHEADREIEGGNALYLCDGIRPEDALDESKIDIHFVINNDTVPDMYRSLMQDQERYAEMESSRGRAANLLGSGQADENGLVF